MASTEAVVATTETKTPAATNAANSAAANAAETATPEVKADAPPSKTYSQEEVDRIADKVRKNAAYRAKRETEARLAGLKEGIGLAQPKPAAQPVPEAPKEPQRADFAEYETYLEARAEWKAERKVEERFSKQKADEAKQANMTQREKAQKRFMEDVAEFAKEEPDAHETLESSEAPLTASMRDALLEADSPARIAVYLAKNPQEAERIAALSSARQAVEIGKLDAKLTVVKAAPAADPKQDKQDADEADAAPAPKAAKEPSKAPEPIKPVGGKATVGNEMPDPAKNPDAWYKWRQDQVRAQRNAAMKRSA